MKGLRDADIRDKMKSERTHNNRGGSRDMRRTGVRTAMAAVLWLAAMVLMGIDIADGPRRDEMGRLALLVGMAAGTYTLTVIMRHHRRVILEVMTWELWMRQSMDGDEDGGDVGNVRAIR